MDGLSLIDELATWRALLAVLAAGVSSFWSRFAEIGRKISPTNWELIKTDVEKVLGALGNEASPISGLSEIARLLDSSESAQRTLFHSLDLVQDPNVLARAALGMSRGYVEDMESRIKVLSSEKKKCVEAFTKISLLLSGEEGVRTVAALGLGAPTWELRGDLSTSLYIAVLASRADEHTEQKLEQLKDSIFGPVRSLLYVGHPLQAMGIVFGPSTLVAGALSHTVVDFTLPRSRKSIVYALGPLIHKSAALEFGPLASIVSGLNFKLVQRLRTIRESSILPIREDDRHPASLGPRAGPGEDAHPAALRIHGMGAVTGPLYYTTDRGLTIRSMLPVGFSDSAAWLPFSGPRPRVEMLGKASEAVIRSVSGAEIDKTLLDEFEEKADYFEETLRATPELVRREISKAFESGDGPRRSALEDVAVGLHKAAGEIMETRILRPLLALGHRVAYAAAREECAITRLVQVDSAMKELGKKIQDDAPKTDLLRDASLTQPLRPSLKLYMLAR